MLNILADAPLQEAPRDEKTNEVHSIKEPPINVENYIEDRTDDARGEKCPLCNTYFQREMNVLAHLRSAHGLDKQKWAVIQKLK